MIDRKSSSPLVSVITVTLNSVKTLEKTIQSVLAQTYPCIEYIIVDGGSLDGTLEIIKKYESKITYWISEKDSGIYQAMNKGIKQAKGEWIHILNSDDYYTTPNALSDFIQRVKSDQNKFYYGTMYLENENGKRTVQKYPFNWLNYWKLYYSAYIAHPTLLVNQEQYQQIGLYDESFKIAADHDLILRLCKKYRAQFLDVPLTVMSLGGASAKDNRKTFNEFKRVTIKNGLPIWLAEIIFRFKVWKLYV
ncbi:MAG: glycosyltransferase family 2 protein [Candidatus Gribaldobacteria bacterium]|nr:glycosyltransferase family 2 protein [Candidatus Gribaldobacteria bacterium]